MTDIYVHPRTLEQRLQFSYDHTSCWLCSAEEAQKILSYQESHLCSEVSQFFTMFCLNQNNTTLSTQSMKYSSVASTVTPTDSTSSCSTQAYLALFQDDNSFTTSFDSAFPQQGITHGDSSLGYTLTFPSVLICFR
jgi:hypothetical protein